jgi:IS4 transposase
VPVREFDLGFYAFRWFDTWTQAGIHFVSRQRQKVSCQVLHVLYDGPAGSVQLRDRLVYLGAYRADRAGQPVRLIEVLQATETHAYLTNVLDPELLPAAHVVALYRRRWDIESAFKLLKSHLNLFLLWSGHPRVVQLQVVATLLLAQVVLGSRNEVAQPGGAELREVSLPLLRRWVPELAAGGYDPVRELVRRGRLAGIIRPFRGRE